MTSSADTATEVRDLTRGRGADLVLDLVGSDDTLALAAAIARPLGHVTLVGIAGGTLPVSFFSPQYEVSVASTYWGSLPELMEVIALAEAGKIRAHVQPFSLDDAPQRVRSDARACAPRPGGDRPMTDAGLDELTLDECVARLEAHRVGRIALLVDEFPLIVPVNYRLVVLPGRHWIAIRTRPGGAIERADMHVAFEIDGLDEERREGWSVVVRGTLHHVDPEAADFGQRFDPDSWLRDERERVDGHRGVPDHRPCVA